MKADISKEEFAALLKANGNDLRKMKLPGATHAPEIQARIAALGAELDGSLLEAKILDRMLLAKASAAIKKHVLKVVGSGRHRR